MAFSDATHCILSHISKKNILPENRVSDSDIQWRIRERNGVLLLQLISARRRLFTYLNQGRFRKKSYGEIQLNGERLMGF